MKICSKCKETKSEDKFSKDKRRESGLHGVCKECTNKRRKEQYEYSEGYVASQLERRYAKIYKCTPKEYVERMNTSDVCEKCGSNARLCYDHDHKTDKFRGVLCSNCNKAIGQLGDTLEGVKEAYEYLKKHYG